MSTFLYLTLPEPHLTLPYHEYGFTADRIDLDWETQSPVKPCTLTV